MTSKIILCTSTTETVVATVKSLNEAFQFASLLQALVNTENYIYYVEYYVKGRGLKRTQPDSFSKMVNNSVNLTNKLKLYSVS